MEKEQKTVTINGVKYIIRDGEAVHFTEQTLTAEQRAQARKNIGIYSGTEIPSDWQEGDIFIDTDTDEGSAESPEDAYELPIATADTLGGVKPVQKTEDMTQPVGVDEFGGLWTAPGGGNALDIDATLTESGKAADAKATGDALANKQPKGSYVKTVNGNAPDANGNVTVETATLTDEQAQSAINSYLEVNPITGATFEKHSGNLWDGVIHANPVLGGSVFDEHNGSDYYRTVVFKAKPNTSYVITAPSLRYDEGFGQANADGICTQTPVGTTGDTSPVTYINWKIGNGGLGQYISIKTNDNFLSDSMYLVWSAPKGADLAGGVVFEGSDPSDYVNVGEYSPMNGKVTSPDLLITEKNLSDDVNAKLAKGGTSVQPEDFRTEERNYQTWLNGAHYSYPVLNSFNIGDVTKLFNTARICQGDENHLQLSEYYAHIPTLTIIGDKAYVAAFQNKVNTVDTVVHGTIELYIVDLAGWTVSEQVSIATPGLACGDDTLKYGGIDPNVLNINDTTLRITFQTQLSDGVCCICYRDYSVTDGTLGDINLCKISDGTTTHDFNVEGVKVVCGEPGRTDNSLNMCCQYTEYNGEYYVALGMSDCYANTPILKTTDFITFTHWATPTVEGNNAHYECALTVITRADGGKRLYTATRQTRVSKKMLIMDVSLTDGSVNNYAWVPDANARPLWYIRTFNTGEAVYLFHMMKSNRSVSTITAFNPSTLDDYSINNIADVFGMTYPSLTEYGDELVIAYMRAAKLYVAKIPKFPIYNHNQVIPMLNKFLDYFVSE